MLIWISVNIAVKLEFIALFSEDGYLILTNGDKVPYEPEFKDKIRRALKLKAR